MTLSVTGACRNLTLGVAAHQTGRVVAVPGCRQWPSATMLLVLDGDQPRWHLRSKGSFSTNTHFPNSSEVSTHKGVFEQHQDTGSARGQPDTMVGPRSAGSCHFPLEGILAF